MSKLFSLEGRVALVTGASRGLGWAIAEALAEHGAHVVLSSRDQAVLDGRAAELEKRGLSAQARAFDAVDRAAGAEAVAAVHGEHGRLDILANNAGIVHRSPVAELTDEDWDRVIETNLTAAFRLSRDAARHMAAAGHGRIINTASIMSVVARPAVASYVASKGGLAALTRALAVEFGPQGVTSNAIAPGYIVSEMTADLHDNPEFDSYVRTRTPLGRWGEPKEIGAVALFLASDASSYVNGHLLVADGGMTIGL
jgi:gluconate 5-dehydrogenase